MPAEGLQILGQSPKTLLFKTQQTARAPFGLHQFPTWPESHRDDTVRVSWISACAMACARGKKEPWAMGIHNLEQACCLSGAREVLLHSQRCLAGHKVLRNGLHKRVLRAWSIEQDCVGIFCTHSWLPSPTFICLYYIDLWISVLFMRYNPLK